LLRAQARIGMSLNYLPPGCTNTWETATFKVGASKQWFDDRKDERLLLCGLMTLKGFVCLYACGWHPKMNLKLQKEAEVLRPRIFFINTTSKTELSKNCKKTKSSHSNCDAICQLYSWVRVREIFWNKLSVRNMPSSPPFLFQFTYSCNVCNCVVCSDCWEKSVSALNLLTLKEASE